MAELPTPEVHTRSQVKRWSIIIATALVGAWLVASTIHEFFANETFRYFSAEPHRLLYVLAIAVIGGTVALILGRASPRARHKAKLFSWGGAAGVLTLSWAFMVYQRISLPVLIAETRTVAWMLVALLLCAALAVYCWVELYFGLKIKVKD